MSGLLLIGGGGHCLSVIDALDSGKFDKVGIIDMPGRLGQETQGVPVVGCDDDLMSFRGEYDCAFVSLGSIGNWQKREKLLQTLDKKGYAVISIMHPKAIITPPPVWERGVFIGPGAVINASVTIGEMCILNSSCVVEHQCQVAPFVHVAPGAVLCGGVTVGKGTHIGAGSVVKESVSIGENVVIGAGSVLVRDIPDNVVAFGNPCRVVRQRGVMDSP